MTSLPEILTGFRIASDHEDAIRLVQSGAVHVNGVPVTNILFVVAAHDVVERHWRHRSPFCPPLVDGVAVTEREPFRIGPAGSLGAATSGRTLFIMCPEMPGHMREFWTQMAGLTPIFARFERCCDVSHGPFFAAAEWRFSPPQELPPACPLIDLPDHHQTFPAGEC